MKKIFITALTERGTTALKLHISDGRKLNKKARLMWKLLGWKQEIIKDYPLTLTVELTNKAFSKMVTTNDSIKKIHEALKQNGALYPVDYRIDLE